MATCANCIHHSLCDYNTNISGNGKVRLVYAEDADVKCSFFQNTADVAPKSEVEKLQNELMIWKQNRFNLYQKLECYAMARQKVAREIFEEIEKITSRVLCLDINAYSAYEELKKKYTEGEG